MNDQLLTAIDYNETSGCNMMIVWDLERRDNHSCAYSTLYLHNSWSSQSKMEELEATMKHIEEYYSVYKSFHNMKMDCTIGGKPTVNSNFFKFVQYDCC